jgi:hypothetical protein
VNRPPSDPDQYSAAPSYPIATFGSITLTAGNHIVRLTAAGKNPASSGYMLSADRFTLIQERGPAVTRESPRCPDGRGGVDSSCAAAAGRPREYNRW